MASTQVLIVGAGPTGLILACACRRQGLSVRIIDKKSGPSTTSKAIGLQYRVSELLAILGMAPRFLAEGGKPTRVNLYADGDKLVTLRFDGTGRDSGLGAFAPTPIMIAQSDTERLLGQALAEIDVTIEWGIECIDFSDTGNRVCARVHAAGGTESAIEAAWLVSCEGAHSTVRKQAGFAFEGRALPLAFVMADVALTGPVETGENHVWMHADGSLAALPFREPGRWRIFIETPRDVGTEARPPELETIRRLIHERTGRRDLTISDPRWISPFRIQARVVDRYRKGRVFVAGDAAHIHSPTGGQGITTGAQDAMNLAWKLANVERGAPDALIESYATERRPHAVEVLKETTRTTTIFFAPSRALRLLRDAVVLPLLRSAWVQRRMFAKLSQLHVHYRTSPLSHHQDRSWFRSTRVRAGDRAPDIAFDTPGRQSTTLFALLGSGRPVVLLSPGPSATACVHAQQLLDRLTGRGIDAHIVIAQGEVRSGDHPRLLIDVHGEMKRIYGVTGEWLLLVRPDDHVGLFQRPIDEIALDDYLARIFGVCSLDGFKAA